MHFPSLQKTYRALSLSYFFLSGHTYTPDPQMISTHVDDHHYFSYRVLRSLQRENVHGHSVTRQIAPLAGGQVSHSNTRWLLPQPGGWAHLNIFRVFMFYLKELLFSRSAMSSSSKTPWTVAHQGPLSMRFSRHGVPTQERVAISFSRGSSPPRDPTCVSCIAGGFFTTEPPGKPYVKAFIMVLITKWNDLLMLSALLVIINHRAVSKGKNQEASVATKESNISRLIFP